ncbi:MAG TPA: vWA domain-containing protein [Acidimicrobiales bacterium]
MSYSAEISRANPTCFVILVDRSLSMADPIGGGSRPMRKADAVVQAINGLLSELAVKCAKDDGVRDYFHVAVIGYGAEITSGFHGPLSGRWLVPLSAVAAMPLRLDERVPAGAGAAGRPVRIPVWVEPVAFGDTPMQAALAQAYAVVREWLAVHPGCFPPIVLNITDGESTDGDPEPVANALRELASADGPVLLFNLHLSTDASDPLVFPADGGRLPDAWARKLCSMSSYLPAHMVEMARRHGLDVSQEGAKGFVFNADVSSVVQFLDIGTQVLNLR